MMEIVEEQIADVEGERKEVIRGAVMLTATFTFGFFIALFVAEPSEHTGLMLMGSLLGFAAVAGGVALGERLRCTKRVG